MIVVEYTCQTCDWKGSNPAIVEDNLDPVEGPDGRLHEPLRHTAVCRLCYGPVTSQHVFGNNVVSFSR